MSALVSLVSREVGMVFTKEQHFDLIALGELVTLELILNLLISLFSLLLLGTHATAHLGVLCWCSALDTLKKAIFGCPRKQCIVSKAILD